MKDKRRKLVLWILFLIVNIISWAKETDSHELKIAQKDWRVGVSMLKTKDNNPDLAPVAALIPRLIQEELRGIEMHELTASETSLLRGRAVEEKHVELYARISSLYASRDEYFFNSRTDPSALTKVEKEITDASLDLDYWLSPPDTAVSVPAELQVVFPDPPDGGKLWNVTSYSPDAFRKNVNLDALITGSITRVGDYYGFRISAIGPVGEDVLWEGVGNEKDFEIIASEAGAAARRLILGRDWASITVQTNPLEAVISVNGKRVGAGLWTDASMLPGVIVIEATATGYSPVILTETLTANEIRNIDITLNEAEQGMVLVKSTPPGASVRLGSIWLGRAPLLVDRPDRVMAVTVEKEGYVTRTIPLYPESESLTVSLDYALVDSVEELAISRKKLYNAIAWFSFSLAPTVIFLGVSRNYAHMKSVSTSLEDQRSSYDAYQLSTIGMWSSVVVNLGLLTNVFFKLSRYLKAAEALSE